MLADVLGQRLSVPSVPEASALGAASLAMVGVGALPDIGAVRQFVQVAGSADPDDRLTKVYGRSYDIYMATYWSLGERFRDIAALQRG
jgi:sugar (pentulose or hexulose) kinase